MTASERIYLQGAADTPNCEDPNSGVTWCWHQIDDTDVEYVRADIAARATAEQSIEATVPYSLYVAGCRDFERVAARCDDAAEIISALQKALAYWMPKVFDDRSAHDAYLLMGYNGEDEPSYWDTKQSTDALYTMDQMREFADNFYLSQLQILVAEKEAYERHAPKTDLDSVIEQCAKAADTSMLNCGCAAKIRALKSQQDAAIEAKPAEQPDTQRLDWIMDNQCVLAHTRDLEGWGVIQVFYEDGDLVTRKVERLIHNTKREAIDAAIESQRSGDGS